MTTIDFDILEDSLVGDYVDHNVYASSHGKKKKIEQKEDVKEKDVPEIQKQIISI